MPDKFYTKKQLEVEKWINELGFMTELEVPVNQYCLDIYLPELECAVEVDGPQHYDKANNKRDSYILENSKIKNIFRFKVDILEEDFKEEFQRLINAEYRN